MKNKKKITNQMVILKKIQKDLENYTCELIFIGKYQQDIEYLENS